MLRLRTPPQPQRILESDASADTPPRRRRRRTESWCGRTRRTMVWVLASTLGSVGLWYLGHRNGSQEPVFDIRGDMEQAVPPLRPIDYKYFTVRINTWEREDQLQLSIQHHLSCPSVLQIQVIWCIAQANAIPDWLLQLEQDRSPHEPVSRVVIERHAVNSLNERFHILSPIPTAAVLSIDDDVLRPCLALDHAFQKWFRNPDRQVGFDARSHEIVYLDPHDPGTEHHHQEDPSWPERWKYAYMSFTEKSNLYSLTLTRYCFLHQHYLSSYMTQMPQEIRDTVAKHFNCEDIAMSLWITSHTQGQPPLLADYWAVKSQIKLYVPKKISGTANHKTLRDDCVDTFSRLLGLQEDPPLHTVPLHLGTSFDYGAVADDWNAGHVPPLEEWPEWHQFAAVTVPRWKTLSPREWMEEWRELHRKALEPMIEAGFIEKTPQWKERFQPGR
jgi:glucuronyl/N-acetylglucosaminyl transferase EXT2